MKKIIKVYVTINDHDPIMKTIYIAIVYGSSASILGRQCILLSPGLMVRLRLNCDLYVIYVYLHYLIS